MDRILREIEPMLDYLKAFASTAFAWIMAICANVSSIVALLAIIVTVLNIVALCEKIKGQRLEYKIKQIKYDRECHGFAKEEDD